MKKNILAVLSVICLLFAACSDEAANDNTSSAAGEQSRVESADQNQSSITESPSGGSSEVEKIFLSDNILYWAIPDLCDISVENLNSLNRYLADNNYDFNLDFVSLPFDSYFSELENYSGELDIAFTGFNTDTNAVCSLMRNGYFAEMDSLLEGSQLYSFTVRSSGSRWLWTVQYIQFPIFAQEFLVTATFLTMIISIKKLPRILI